MKPNAEKYIMISGHSRHRSKVDALHQIHSLHVHAPGTTFETKRKIYTVNVYTTQLHVKRQIHLHNIAMMAPGRAQIICQILPSNHLPDSALLHHI